MDQIPLVKTLEDEHYRANRRGLKVSSLCITREERLFSVSGSYSTAGWQIAAMVSFQSELLLSEERKG